MSRPFSRYSSGSPHRINGKIRAREVRVIEADGGQVGVLSLFDAIKAARDRGVDLVEIAPNATPPVCKLIDYGRWRYEEEKRAQEARKHQHATRLKEIQLSPAIDPHDFGIKLKHGIGFLCEDMKVKIVLKFRGREMAHKDIGFQVVQKFIKDLESYGHPDSEPRLIGRGVVVIISPLPRAKRAKNPNAAEAGAPPAPIGPLVKLPPPNPRPVVEAERTPPVSKPQGGFLNTPFASLNLPLDKDASDDAASGS